MIYAEIYRDIFTVGKEYYLAHCIASDLRMGAGVAVKMQKEFGLRGKIQKQNVDLSHPTCVLTGRVFNLITKKRSSGKPSQQSLELAIDIMADIAIKKDISKIAMVKIGCGLDRLSWPYVKIAIKNAFSETNIEILVCKWRKK